MQSKKVGISGVNKKRYAAGIGYVIIPAEVDRDEYVRECLSTGYIAIQGEENNAISKVKCSRQIIQELVFPNRIEDFGSQVLYISIPKHQQLVAIAIVDNIDEYSQLGENTFKFFRDSENGYVLLEGDAKGNMVLSVNSSKTDGGVMTLDVTNEDESAELNINVKGSVNINSSAKVTQISESEFELKVGESLINIQDGLVQITSEEIKHNEASEPMVLGDTLADFLDDFISAVSAITVATSIGARPIINKVQVENLKTKLEDFKSQKSKLE